MKTYKVVTIHKTVHVYNVICVDVDFDEKFLEFRREGAGIVTFPIENVISYEEIR